MCTHINFGEKHMVKDFAGTYTIILGSERYEFIKDAAIVQANTHRKKLQHVFLR